jgi:hypothetical protein
VAPNVDVLGTSLHDAGGDESESSLIVAVDWRQLSVVAVNAFLELE